MARSFRAFFIGALAVLVGVMAIAVASFAFDSGRPPHLQAHAATSSNQPVVPNEAAQFADYLQWRVETLAAYLQYQTALDRQAVADYIVATIAAEEAAAAAARQPAFVPSGGAGDGSCYGGPIPDYIVTRESGGNPEAMNPSGAYGCYQIMPEWWSKPGPDGCAQFDRSISGQKACTAVIWRGGAGASNWSTG